MTVVPISVTQSNLQQVQGDFLVSILDPSVRVVEGRQNRVAEPRDTDFVVMMKAVRRRLATNTDTWDMTNPAPPFLSVGTPMECRTQLDIHGPNSAENAQRIHALWRDDVATTFFANSGFAVSPLYADEPKYIEFVNAENQWEDRWIVDVHTQGNFVLQVPQAFADTAKVTMVELA